MPSKNPKKPIYPVDCAVCNHHEERPWHFSKHVLSNHGLTAQQYTIQYLRAGKEPRCLECGAETRYCTFAFKDYCKEHSFIAERKGGQLGGKIKTQWNKGKTAEEDARIAVLSGEKNAFFGKKHTLKAKQSNANKHRLTEDEFNLRVNSKPERFKCLSPYSEYQYRQGQKLLFQCQTCLTHGRDTVVEHTLFNFEKNPICKVCHPGGSKEQFEIAEYITSLGFDVIYNDRTAIAPKELDIFIPSKKLAIEYNSFYYHSYSEDDKRKDRHYEKTAASENAGINLVHVFQDEWLNKHEIVKSMISHRLGVAKRRIFARKCSVREIDKRTAKIFLNANHIAGVAPAFCHLGLFLNEELISVLSLRRPFNKKYRIENVAEIARFASALNTSVVGGLGKLMKAATQKCIDVGFHGILSYADLRYGRGHCYEHVGLQYIGRTGLSYDYNDGTRRMGRAKYQAQHGKSEVEVANDAGVRRIYGCGSNIYIMKF